MIFAGAGLIMLICAALTVHDRTGDEVATNSGAARTHLTFAHWRAHGYLQSGGVAVRRAPDDSLYFHRSSAGGRLISGYLVARGTYALTGREGWRVVALHNQAVTLLAAILLGLLGFRLATLSGVPPFHALLLGLSLQGVWFTFPDNLARYWEVSGREWFLVFAAIFLLLEVRRLDEGGRRLSLVQGASVFLLMHMEYKTGVFFVASYIMATMMADRDRATLTRLAVVTVLPCLLALGVIAGQVAVARASVPDIPVEGSGFLFRTGLDGSPQYYTDHLDIAFGRDVARGNFPHAGDWLFRWTWLFAAGATAVIAVLAAAMRGRVPRATLISIVSLLGTYVLTAALFSQSVVIHPYLYDVLLFTPLALALLVIVPALVERVTDHRGVLVLVVLFLAIWISMVQARRYALWYPPAPNAASETTR
jgi:hypothetical protein